MGIFGDVAEGPREVVQIADDAGDEVGQVEGYDGADDRRFVLRELLRVVRYSRDQEKKPAADEGGQQQAEDVRRVGDQEGSEQFAAGAVEMEIHVAEAGVPRLVAPQPDILPWRGEAERDRQQQGVADGAEG